MGGLPKIAFAAAEPVLLTIDDATLRAWDAVLGTARWQLAFDELLGGVVFASMRALPRATGNPWRSPASGCEAVAIDVAGGIHVVDASAGTLLATHRVPDRPKTAAGRGDVLAVGLRNRLIVWRDGVRHELDLEAEALAFSRDGLTLGVATSGGELVIVDARTVAVTATHELCLDVNGLTASRYGWIVATDRDLRAVDADGVVGQILDGPVIGTSLDVAGKRVAVHRSDTSITIYPWPPVAPQARIKLGKGHLVDVMFGEGDALAVGIDRGDAAIVDVAACTHVRTEATPARHWVLDVEDEGTRMARTRVEARVVPPPARDTSGRRVLGIMLMAGVGAAMAFSVGIANRTKPPATSSGLKAPSAETCDATCARGRLMVVEDHCKRTPELRCQDEARAALGAFNAGRCSEVRAGLSRIEAALARADTSAIAVATKISVSVARSGLATGCVSAVNTPPLPYDPPRQLIRLAGPELTPEVDDIVLRASDHPKLWAAPSGALTLLTRGQRASCMLRTRSPSGSWKTVHDDPLCKHTALFVRSPVEAYASFDGAVLSFDGTTWKESEPALSVPITSLAGAFAGNELYALDEAHVVHRRQGTSWITEPSTPSTAEELFPGRVLMGIGTSATRDDALLRWTTSGFVVHARANAFPIVDLWMSPRGHLFAARGATVGHSLDDGATWIDTPVDGFNDHVWGRSDAEVYVAGDRGVRRFDGKTWSTTTFEWPVDAMAGNASDLWVVAQKR